MSDRDVSPAPIRWDAFPSVANHEFARKQLVIEAALGLSRNTLEAYGRAREDFFRFCAGLGVNVSQADREDVALWVRDLLTRPVRPHGRRGGSGLANASIQQKATAVRLFFDFLIDEGQRGTNPAGHGRYGPGRALLAKRGLIPRHRTLPWIPSDEEWQAIINVVAAESIRNRLMFCLAYDAALRREELCSLLLSDFDFANRLVTVRAMVAKGRHQRVVPYSQVSAALITQYLKHRRGLSIAAGAVFLSESPRNRAEPLTIWTWSKAVKRLAVSAGVAAFSTHTLRHLCLTDLARSGWDLHEIASFAGHRSIETTKAYINLSCRDLAAKLARGMDQIHRWRLGHMQEWLG